MTRSGHDLRIDGSVLKFRDELKPFSVWIEGQPVTSSQRYKNRSKYQDWIRCVKKKVKVERERTEWERAPRYAVTLEFRFRPRRHQSHEGDLDNYVKPVLDGLGKGLGVDDSNFRILLIRRLPNAETPEDEGVRLFVSTTGHPPPG